MLAIVAATVLDVTMANAPALPAPQPRATELDRVLAEDARKARLWYTGWAAFYTVASGFSLKVALDADDRDRRVSSAVDGIRSGIGLVTTVLLVPPSMATPAFAPDDVASREAWLKKAADAERLGRSWVAHVANAAVNAAGGAYLWLHEHRFGAGLLAFLSGTAIGELKIWTQPTTALEASRAATVSLSPLASPSIAGLALDARF